jgi:N-acetylglutamate synthase-like GNAT family acetyltransferase
MKSIATIHTGAPDDLARVRRLMKGVDALLKAPVAGTRHLLVLDKPDGEVAAAAVLVIDKKRGHVVGLAIAPDLAATGLEERFIAVMEAMCEAFGVRSLDIPARNAA